MLLLPENTIMKLTACITVFALFLSGCTYTQYIDINEDQSGTYSTEIEFSAMTSMLPSDSAEADPLTGFNVDSMVDALNKMEGISNASVTNKEGSVKTSYNFSSMSALNNSINRNRIEGTLSGDKSKVPTNFTYISTKPNSFTYKAQPMSKETKESMEEAGLTLSFIEYEMIIRFPHPVKKINNPAYTLSADKRTVSFKANVEKISSGEVSPDFTAKY